MQYAPDLVSGVLAGSPGLDKAYEEAQRRKLAQVTEAEQFAALRREAPDLGDRVTEEQLTIKEGLDLLAARRREAAERRRLVTGNIANGLDLLDPHIDEIGRYLEEWGPFIDWSALDAGAVSRVAKLVNRLERVAKEG